MCLCVDTLHTWCAECSGSCVFSPTMLHFILMQILHMQMLQHTCCPRPFLKWFVLYFYCYLLIKPCLFLCYLSPYMCQLPPNLMLYCLHRLSLVYHIISCQMSWGYSKTFSLYLHIFISHFSCSDFFHLLNYGYITYIITFRSTTSFFHSTQYTYQCTII